MYVLLYLVVGLLALYLFLRKDQRKGKPIPGPTGLPIAGYAFNLHQGTVHDTFAKLAETYGDIFKIKAFGQNMVVVNNAEMIRSLFCADPYKRYTNDRVETFYGHYVLFGSKSIFSTPNAFNSPHGDLRKAFTRGVHVYGEGIKAFETKVQTQMMKLIEDIERMNGEEFDIQDILIKSLCNIVSIFFCGDDLDDEKGSNIYWEFVRSLDYLLRPDVDLILMTFPFLRFVPGLYKKPFDTIMRDRDKILKRQYYDAKKTYQPGVVRGLVDFYLAEQRLEEEEGRPPIFTDDRICALLLESIAGGILTSISIISSILLCLMNHPEYQTRIQEELDTAVDKQELPSLSNREECVFLEAVFLETSRLLTTLPLLVPRTCGPQMEFEGHDIPAKSMIFANAWYIHHDKKVWGDPWTFRPERWIDSDGQLLPNDHVLRKNWLPFGTGRRQCIGESFARSRTFLFISTLLQRWTFEMSPEHAVPCDPRAGHMDVDIALRPKPYLCRVVPRKYMK